MTQHNVTDLAEPITVAAHVPLSDRPLVAEDENTVISVPEQPRSDVHSESTPTGDAYRQRLFPASGNAGGEEAGIRLAHFEIVSRLGAGGMGAVFKATDLELARDVALKILHPSSSQDPSLISRFRNEARACAQLNHDNIARVFYAGSQDGLHFIAYEFASGQTIRDLIIDRGRLSIEDTVNYAIQVTLALNHISAAGIVHRDIKPSNIMLTTSGRVKVVDLGLARRDITDSIGDITVAGTTLGTFDYISPEQARDPRNADVRSDIYSLGCTMYHMLTGQPPYPDGTALQKLLDHQGKSPPNPCLLNSEVPRELAAIMRKMMANNPAHRYQAPGLLLNDLIQLAAVLGLHSVPAEGIVWRKLVPESNRQPLGALWVFVSVLLICLTAIFLQRSSRSSELGDQLATDAENPGIEVNPEVYAANAVESSKASVLEDSDRDGTIQSSAEQGSAAVEAATGVLSNTNSTDTPGAGLAELINSNRPVPILPNAGIITSEMIDLIVASEPSDIQAQILTSALPDPFVLQSSDGTSKSFRTLQAAVADARSGDVVLLRYNGFPKDVPAQPPVRIEGMNLIIRAADGFRPTLEFKGVSDETVTPGQMFNLRSQGSLAIRDIDLRLIVRNDLTADRCSLIHCEGPNRIELENVSIECRNRDHQPTTIFDLSDESTGPVDTINRPESEFKLTRVICRADADVFRISCQPRARIHLENCGLGLNGTLLQIRGDDSMASARGSIQVFLDHVTCIHSAPMMFMNDSDERKGTGPQRTLPQLTIRSEASVFAGVGSEATLFYSQGNSYLEDIETLVTWNGFTNLYDGYQAYWQIETPALDFSTRRLDFSQWQQLWRNRSDSEDMNSEVLSDAAWHNPEWKNSGNRLSLSDLTPSSFELNSPASLPKARDSMIPGVNAQELPPFPRTPAPEQANSSGAAAVKPSNAEASPDAETGNF